MSQTGVPPLFITFEGVEGCGKSTQIQRLKERITATDLAVMAIREPGGTVAGDAIRSILLSQSTGSLDPVTELLLFSAARRQLIAEVIAPSLKNGVIVLCDRFIDSTMAYQGYGRKLNRAMIDHLTATVVGDLAPTVTLLLDVPVTTGLDRAVKRLGHTGLDEGRFEGEAVAFHDRVAAGFRALALAHSNRIVPIDARGTVDEVAEKIWVVVAPFITLSVNREDAPS